MNKRHLLAGVLGLTMLSCSKLTKEEAEAAVSAYYTNNGREECTADVDIVPSATLFACDDYRCRRCADALLRQEVITKTDKPDIYRYMRTAMRVDVGQKKLQVYCARKSAVVTRFRSKGDSGSISVRETTEPIEKAQLLAEFCGLRVPERETRPRDLEVKRDKDGHGWTVQD